MKEDFRLEINLSIVTREWTMTRGNGEVISQGLGGSKSPLYYFRSAFPRFQLEIMVRLTSKSFFDDKENLHL